MGFCSTVLMSLPFFVKCSSSPRPLLSVGSENEFCPPMRISSCEFSPVLLQGDRKRWPVSKALGLSEHLMLSGERGAVQRAATAPTWGIAHKGSLSPCGYLSTPKKRLLSGSRPREEGVGHSGPVFSSHYVFDQLSSP